jgi:hypothetical protein
MFMVHHHGLIKKKGSLANGLVYPSVNFMGSVVVDIIIYIYTVSLAAVNAGYNNDCNHPRLQPQRSLRERKRNRIISKQGFGSRRGTAASPWPQGSGSEFQNNSYMPLLPA